MDEVRPVPEVPQTLKDVDAVRLHGETMPSTDGRKRMWTFYAPVGTWGIITPWNFPLLMLAEFVAPGLATGNAHVVKPPANTPPQPQPEPNTPQPLFQPGPAAGVPPAAVIPNLPAAVPAPQGKYQQPSEKDRRFPLNPLKLFRRK